MSDKKDSADNNEALLKSLESIKALLAQSETKLSAARESLHQANQGTAMRKKIPETDIPTLEEIVEVGQQIQIDLPDEDDIPILESIEEEAAVFNLADDDDDDYGEATMTIDTSSLPFEDVDDEALDAIPVLATEFEMEEQEEPEPAPVVIAEEPVEASAAVELPDFTPLLSAIDAVEGTMRAQISEAAIAFEEKLNTQLDVQMRKLREQLHLLADKFEK